MSGDLWEVRKLRGGLDLELRGGEKPALVIVQSEESGAGPLRCAPGLASLVELTNVKVVAAMADAAADLAGVLAAGGVYHGCEVGFEGEQGDSR